MTRRRGLAGLSALAAVAVAGACGDAAQVICPLGYGPTIEVEVWDAGANLLAARRAYGAAWRGGELDSLMPATGAFGDTLLSLWNNRPGTYDVEVQKVGLSAWDTTGLVVRSSGGACATVVTERIVARLDLL
jgi:hypothetical protein